MPWAFRSFFRPFHCCWQAACLRPQLQLISSVSCQLMSFETHEQLGQIQRKEKIYYWKWWHHAMETLSVLLSLCNENPPGLTIKTIFPSMGISIIKIRRLRPSYLYNGNSYTSKTTSLYWDGQQIPLTTGQYLMRSFGVFFAISLDELSSKQSNCWWFVTLTVIMRFLKINMGIKSNDVCDNEVM